MSSAGSSRPKVNLRSTAVKRIMQEANELSDPSERDFVAAPLETDIFEWHCTMRGVEGSEFEGGLYHLRILLPPSYPMSAPDIILLTPNGRFELGKKICIDGLTSFHAGSWQPAWGVRTAILGLRSFWMQGGEALSAIGALDTSKEERKRLAKLSKEWVCPTCACRNSELLPDEASDPTAETAGGRPLDTNEDGLQPEIDTRREEPHRPPIYSISSAGPLVSSFTLPEPEPDVPWREEDPLASVVPIPHVEGEEERDVPQPRSVGISSTPNSVPIPTPSSSHDTPQPQPLPTPTIPLPSPAQPQQTSTTHFPALLQQNRRGVPLWLDALIFACVSMLAVLLMRKAVVGGGRDEGATSWLREDL
ncbi:putative ubiquitin conjugating enzyme [Dioszegia hungarica]|uniref:Ubiquitin conjugating enzyme n=1 Tax=Dioszegia hungarica TaxID=4972 RepID=A0AA38LUD5_9TREE|nr:putative ubiquitin conjugating enzyme [Dioszegia hungarica]KAI9637452.1 putative ubiquitin conjugating enzyme [Dioszegia hungarica]